MTLPTTVLKLLQEHVDSIESGLIFTSSNGKPLWAANIYHHFKRTIKELGLPEIRFHDLRHAHATLLLRVGVNPKVVQERLGHSQIPLTLDTCSHVVPSLQKDAAEKFEFLLN